MTTPRNVSVAKIFSKFPAGRHRSDGPYSGEAFRDQFLYGPLSQGQSLIVDLNGTAGFGSSFLEEAFGGLVRRGIPAPRLRELLTLVCDDQSVVDEVKDYINRA